MKRKIVLSLLCLFLVVCSIPIAFAEGSDPAQNPPAATPTEPEKPKAPEAPTIQTDTSTCKQIVLNAVEGCEYALVKQGAPATEPIKWQPNPVFTEFEVGVTYTIYQRIPANGEVPASDPSVGLVYTPTHQYENSVVAPTCTEKGYTKHVCKHCGNSYIDAEQAALGHDYEHLTVAPTCTAKGYTKHTCKRCGNSYTDAVKSALGHKYKNSTVAPTCTAKGYTKHTCTRCGHSYTDAYKSALGHKLSKTAAKKATCTASGHKEYWTCTRCKKVFGDSKGKNSTTVAKCQLKALGHAYQETIAKATPSKNGSIRTVCKRCGTKKSSTTIYRPNRLILSRTSYGWDGGSHRPTVKVMCANGKALSSKHYTVSYPRDTSSTGKHTITVTFRDKKYSGSMTASYVITSRSITNKAIHLSRQNYTYNGKAHEPKVTIDGLTRGTHYTVTYLNNVNAGFASVRITGKGNYTGTVKKTFTIRPRRTAIKKLTAHKAGFSVRWKAVQKQVSGYEIEYARKSNFAKATAIREKADKHFCKAEGLQSGKNYYVRVRAYKQVGKTRVYSRWSELWKVETKDGTSGVVYRAGKTKKNH